jgi:hypothetical protein
MEFNILKFSDNHIIILTDEEYKALTLSHLQSDGFLPCILLLKFKCNSIELSNELIKLSIDT